MTDQITDPGVSVLKATEAATETGLEHTPAPAYLDTTEHTTVQIRRQPVIPAALHRANVRGTMTQAAGLTWHRTRYHGLRSPWYLFLTVWHALRGAGRLTGQVARWWHWTPGWVLESQAVAAGRAGHHEAMRAHTQGLKTRAARGRIVVACFVILAVALVLLVVLTPWWAWALTGSAVALVLARHGRPDGKR